MNFLASKLLQHTFDFAKLGLEFQPHRGRDAGIFEQFPQVPVCFQQVLVRKRPGGFSSKPQVSQSVPRLIQDFHAAIPRMLVLPDTGEVRLEF